MIKKVEKSQLVIKVIVYKDKDDRSNTQIVTYIVDGKEYYILDIIEHVRSQSFIPTYVYVYEPNKIQPDEFMIHENGSIQYLDNYWN